MLPANGRNLRQKMLLNAVRQDRAEERRNRRRARVQLRENIDPFLIPDAEFIRTFRLTKAGVRQLAEDLTPLIPNEERRDGISVMLKIQIALCFYASGSYQTLVGQSALHNVSQTTVSRALRQVTVTLNHPTFFKKYVKWPLQLEERNLIKSRFYNKFKIPGVLGCIDGTHVAIIRPSIHEKRYYNRKGYHSLSVMIICDSDLNILCMDPSTPGRAHDANVWQDHPLYEHLRDLYAQGEEVFLLGDSGYPLRKMITPIINTTEGTPDYNFYVAHVTARNTRCIGVLKARFRCLLAARALHYSPCRAGEIVNACSVLHNMANRLRTPVELLTPEELEEESNSQEEENYHQILGLRADADAILLQNDNRNRRVNRDLLEGRALQRAPVERLWRDRN